MKWWLPSLSSPISPTFAEWLKEYIWGKKESAIINFYTQPWHKRHLENQTWRIWKQWQSNNLTILTTIIHLYFMHFIHMKNEGTTFKCYIHQITWNLQWYKFNQINLICKLINQYAINYKINNRYFYNFFFLRSVAEVVKLSSC